MRVDIPRKTKKKRRISIDSLLAIAIVLCSIASFNSTYYGFRSTYAYHAEKAWLTWFLPIFITFGVQILLIASVLKLKRSRGLMRRFAWVVMIVLAMMISTGYGISYWDEAIGARERIEVKADGIAYTAMETLGKGISTFDTFVRATEDLAEHSEKMAEREDKSGNSCGCTVRKGQGPRWRKRMSDLHTMRSHIPHIRGLRDSLNYVYNNMIDRIEDFDVHDVESFSKSFKIDILRANKFIGDEQIAILDGWLVKRLKQNEDGFFDDGKKYTCPDPILKEKMLELRSAIDHLSPLPNPGEIRIDGSNAIESIKYVYGAFKNALLFMPKSTEQLEAERREKINSPSVDEDSSKKVEPVAILIGCTVDLLIILVGFLYGPTGGSSPDPNTPLLGNAAETLKKMLVRPEYKRLLLSYISMNKDTEDLGRFLRKYMTLLPDGRYIIGFDSEDIESVERDTIIEMLDLWTIDKLVKEIDPKKEPYFKKEAKNSTNYQYPEFLWELSKNTSPATLRIAMRILQRRIEMGMPSIADYRQAKQNIEDDPESGEAGTEEAAS